MSGLQEILILVLVIVVLFTLPRMLQRGKESKGTASLPQEKPMHGRTRLAILASGLWPAMAAVLLEPWHGEIVPFLVIGLLPVGLGWAIAWVVRGYKKES
ncbi:MAG: hypothetical protein PVG49_14970 [Desulfobacteraceae bacterium]